MTLQYTSRDFESLRLELIERAKRKYASWTDFETASFGTALIDLMAHVGDVLAYDIDRQARESRLQTAEERSNVLALAEMLGYRPSGRGVATVDVTLSTTQPLPDPVLVPEGTEFRTRGSGAVRFFTTEATRIEAGETTIICRAMHAEPHEESFAPGLITLAHAPVVTESVTVRSGGEDFTQVDSLVHSGPTDRHFVVRVDASDRAHLVFGDGIVGMAPASTVQVRYKTGGGPEGNVEAGTLTELGVALYDASGRPVALTAHNARAATGGSPRETLRDIRRRAPASLRMQKRAVSREDFELVALGHPAVARALLVTRDEVPMVAENTGLLFVVPQGGGIATDELCSQVLARFKETPPTVTFALEVRPAVMHPVNVTARIEPQPSADPFEVADAIRGALGRYFDVHSGKGAQFGYVWRSEGNEGALPWSDVFHVVHDTPGVRRVAAGADGLLLDGAPRDVSLSLFAFPSLGEVHIAHAVTGEAL